MTAIVASERKVDLTASQFKTLRKITQSTSCVGGRIKTVLAGLEMKRHNLKQSKGSRPRFGARVATGLDLHHKRHEVRVQAELLSPLRDLGRPMLHFACEERRNWICRQNRTSN